MKELRESILPNLLGGKIPHPWTLRRWFDQGRVPRMKANHLALRGGGETRYYVSHIEKLIAARTTLKIPTAARQEGRSA